MDKIRFNGSYYQTRRAGGGALSPVGQKGHDQAVFGPVPSRRLGLSLGVDLLLPKTCTLSCRYCELGPTGRPTTERGRFRDADQVLTQVKDRLAQLPQPPDFITLAGSGEPTLHQEMGRVIRALRQMSPAKVAVLTNGTLMFLPEVRAGLMAADVVIPSLDAVSDDIFLRLNRPAQGLDPAQMIQGLIQFAKQYQGKLWLEMLIVKGFNDSDREVKALADAAAQIGPDMVQLNTVVRPPALSGTLPVSHQRLQEIAQVFSVPVQIIAAPQAQAAGGDLAVEDQLVEMCRRRPLTISDVAAAFGLGPDRAKGLVRELITSGRMKEERFGDDTFYRGC